MKKWSEGNEEFFMCFPVDGKNICAACHLEINANPDLSKFKEAKASDVCDNCGGRFDSDRAEEASEEISVLAFM
jgi:hypothetical protein